MPRTVLIADSLTSAREHWARQLRDAGFRVLEAADGAQALATCRRELPEALVLADHLAALNGLTVCRALRDDTALPYVPIAFIATSGRASERATLLRAGGDDVLNRDIDETELVARVELLLRTHDRLQSGRRVDDPSTALTAIHTEAEISVRLPLEFGAARQANDALSLAVVEFSQRLSPEAWLHFATLRRGRDLLFERTTSAVLLLPSTHLGGAMATAERIALAMPTPTIGIACFPNPAIERADDLLVAAEQALRTAKEQGPGHVCLLHHQTYIFRPAMR